MHELFRRFSIRSKFIGVQVTTIILMGVFALGIITYLIQCQNETLYQSVCQTLQYMANDVDEALRKAAQFSSQVIALDEIQNNLSALSETESAYILKTARKNLFSSLQSLCNQYDGFTQMDIYVPPDTNGHGIQGTHFSGVTSSSPPVTDENWGLILRTARLQEGGITWLRFPEDSNGLYLTRMIRKIAKLEFSELGVLLCRLDFQKITAIADASNFGAEQIIIREKDGSLLYTNGLADVAWLDDSFKLNQIGYDILKIQQESYFVTRLHTLGEGRSYYFLLPYQHFISRVSIALYSVYIALAVGIIFLILLSVSLTHTITDPLRQLNQSMRRYVADKVGKLPATDDIPVREEETTMLRRQFDTLAEQIDLLIRENYEKQLLIKEAQYEALEQQLNPHFLYNTLDAVFWRAASENRTEIAEMTRCLAAILRKTLESEPFISLHDEVELIEDYLSIQKYRFGPRLSFEKQIDERYLDFLIPRLCVQPLVENAVNYGLEQCLDVCHLILKVYCNEGVLYIEVLNDGSAFEDGILGRLMSGETKPNGLGVGLKSIYQRCRMTYGDAYGLELLNNNGFAMARLRLPLNRGGM
ncbi:MAG: histidine kinase [Eubacteriales bacterium]|nr:histidine kinase [Eubacteriales bacterium]